MDYRLLEDNRYEIVGTNKHKVSDFENFDSFLEALNYNNNSDFESSKPITVSKKKAVEQGLSSEKYAITTKGPSWCQFTYRYSGEKFTNFLIDNDPKYSEARLENLQGRLEYSDYQYYDITNYSLEVFKDENGDTMEFVMNTSSSFDVFGNYYLFYSPNTRLVRLFFQCT